MHIKINIVPFLHVHHVNAMPFFFFLPLPICDIKHLTIFFFQIIDQINQIYTRFFLIPKISQFFVVIKKKEKKFCPQKTFLAREVVVQCYTLSM